MTGVGLMASAMRSEGTRLAANSEFLRVTSVDMTTIRCLAAACGGSRSALSWSILIDGMNGEATPR